MNSVAIHEVLERVRYKRGWTLQWCSRPLGVDLWWSFRAPDYVTGASEASWLSRVWFVENPVTEDTLVKTALAAALQAEEHECREAFTYKGVRLFDPHLSVQELMEAVCPST